MKLTALGDFGKWLLSPEFTEKEALALEGHFGLAIATDEDLNLPICKTTRAEVKKAVENEN